VQENPTKGSVTRNLCGFSFCTEALLLDKAMSKESHYFSHDYDTRADDKIKKLIRTHGMMGYGVFWAIVEDLYNNKNSIHLDYDGIAYDLRTDPEIIKSIINDFDLFVFENGSFGSISVEKRIEERNLKSKKASKSAYFRWSKSSANINKEERSSLPQVYIIKVFDESECFIKIGITTSTISERYSGSLPYKYEVLMQIFSPEYIKIEQEINDLLKNFIYSPAKEFAGKLECYSIGALTIIKEFKSSFKVIQLCDRIKIISERIQKNSEGNAIKERIVKERKSSKEEILKEENPEPSDEEIRENEKRNEEFFNEIENNNNNLPEL